MGGRLFVFLGLVTLLGCRGGDGEPACETVCFELLQDRRSGDSPTSTPEGGLTLDDFRDVPEDEEEGAHPFERDEEPDEEPVRDCNAQGLTPGICPQGTYCGLEKETRSGLVRLCESPTPGEVHLVFDLDSRSVPSPIEPVEVTFRFTLDGGAWPPVPPGTTQWSVFVRRIGEVTSRSVPGLTDESGRHTVSLLPGDYEVKLGMSAESERPPAFFRGLLTVVSEGEVTLDVERHVLDLAIDLGVPAEEVEDQSVELQLVDSDVGITTNTVLVTGDAVRTAVAYAAPGTYDLVAKVSGDGALPVGTTTLAKGLSLSQGSSSVQLALEPTMAAGTLTLAGVGLGDIGEGELELVFLETGQPFFLAPEAPTVRVSPGTPPSFALPLFEGPYDVYLRALDDDTTRLPRLGAVVARDFRPGPTMELDVPVLRATGRLSLHGVPLLDVGEGTVVVIRDLDQQRTLEVPVSAEGVASFEALVFSEGRYEVSVRGNGQSLPEEPQVVLEEPESIHELRELDLTLHEVSVRVTIDGEEPAPVADNGFEDRGAVVFVSPDILNAVVLAPLPAQGPAVARAWVPPGRWDVGFHPVPRSSSGTFGIGATTTVVRQIVLSKSEALDDLELSTTNVSVTFLIDGEEPPEAADGFHRGEVLRRPFFGELTIPGQGPATVSWSTLSEVGGLSVQCPARSRCEPILFEQDELKALVTDVQF